MQRYAQQEEGNDWGIVRLDEACRLAGNIKRTCFLDHFVRNGFVRRVKITAKATGYPVADIRRAIRQKILQSKSLPTSTGPGSWKRNFGR